MYETQFHNLQKIGMFSRHIDCENFPHFLTLLSKNNFELSIIVSHIQLCIKDTKALMI